MHLSLTHVRIQGASMASYRPDNKIAVLTKSGVAGFPRHLADGRGGNHKPLPHERLLSAMNSRGGHTGKRLELARTCLSAVPGPN